MDVTRIGQQLPAGVPGLAIGKTATSKREAGPEPAHQVAVLSQAPSTRAEPTTRTNALCSGVVTNTGAADMLRFRIEGGEAEASARAFDVALKGLQHVCDQYPAHDPIERLPKPVADARAEFLNFAECHFKAMGIEVVNNGCRLQIKPDRSTNVGRYASRVRKYGAASVEFDPLMPWYNKAYNASFDEVGRVICMSNEAARNAKIGLAERHEFIHAILEYYCRDLGGNSAFYGIVRAHGGSGLFPKDPYCCCYNKEFSLGENIAYVYEIWWACLEVKRLCEQLERKESGAPDRSVDELRSAFWELHQRASQDPGERIAFKSLRVASQLQKIHLESDRLVPASSFSQSGPSVSINYANSHIRGLSVDFSLVSTRLGESVVSVGCHDPVENNSVTFQITDRAVAQSVSHLLRLGDSRKAFHTLGPITRDHVRPRVTTITTAAFDLCEAYRGLWLAVTEATRVMAHLSSRTLVTDAYREHLLTSLDAVFSAGQTLHASVRKHSRA